MYNIATDRGLGLNRTIEDNAYHGLPKDTETLLDNRSDGDIIGGEEKDIEGGGSSKIDYQQIPKYLRITDGKVEGKIPINEYTGIREASVKNKNAQSITLGKYTPTIEDGIENWSKPGPDSYIVKAGLDSSYFDMGDQWQRLGDKYGLTDQQLFDMFNKPFIDDAIANEMEIRFSHNPLNYRKGALVEEWAYIKKILNISNNNLIKKGDYWYVER